MEKKYTLQELRELIPASEFRFETARSSGAGGQNVNRRETKVQLWWNIRSSSAFSEEEKERIRAYSKRHPSHYREEDDITFWSQQERSQERNKALALDHFFEYLVRALKPEKARRQVRIQAPEWRRRELKERQRAKKEARRFRSEKE